jgi:hypothetical protein
MWDGNCRLNKSRAYVERNRCYKKIISKSKLMVKITASSMSWNLWFTQNSIVQFLKGLYLSREQNKSPKYQVVINGHRSLQSHLYFLFFFESSSADCICLWRGIYLYLDFFTSQALCTSTVGSTHAIFWQTAYKWYHTCPFKWRAYIEDGWEEVAQENTWG